MVDQLESILPEETSSNTAVGYMKEKGKLVIQMIAITLLLMGIAVFLREWLVALGIAVGFGVGLMNYMAMAKIIDRGLTVQNQGNQAAAVFTLLMHLVRFWILAAVLWALFKYFGSKFGLSLILGMSILKWITFMEILESSLTDKIYPPNVGPPKKN